MGYIVLRHTQGLARHEAQRASQASGFRPGWLGLRPGWLGLRLGWMAQRGERMDGQMNGTENLYILQDFVPYPGHCPKRFIKKTMMYSSHCTTNSTNNSTCHIRICYPLELIPYP